MVISFIGYESTDLTVREMLLNEKLILSPANSEIEEVTIRSSEPIVVINRLSAGTEMKLNKILSVGTNTIQGNDILRKLQYLPGISTSDDKSSSVAIRGSDDSETLILVDGIPIYKTDHYYGIFGNVNGSYISDVNLYKNEMPINQSGKSGGLVSMSSPQSVDQLNGSVDINLLTSSATVGIPINDQWNVLLAGRASYNNVANSGFFQTDSDFSVIDNENFNRPTVLGVTPSFDFYDLNAKVSYNSDDLKVNANYFRSHDALTSDYNFSFNTRPTPGTNRPITNEEVFSANQAWENNGASLNFLKQFEKGWSLSSSTFYTQMVDDGSVSYGVSNDARRNPINISINNNTGNNIEDFGSTLMLSKSFESSSFSLGVKYVHHENQIQIGEDGELLFRREGTSEEKVVFGSTEMKINDQFSFNAGIRATHYDLSDQFYISPQLALSYQINNQFKLKASASRNYQYVRELTYSTRFGDERELFLLTDDGRVPVGASNNLMFGATFTESEWLFDVEVYNIERDNVINFTTFLPRLLNDQQQLGRQFSLLSGEGKTIGMDALITYQKEAYTGMLSYTLSKSENNFKEIFKNNPFPAQDDRRHQLSLINSYSIDNWIFSANSVYNSGRTYTDLTLLDADSDRRIKDSKDFLKRLPFYLRFDLSASYNFDIQGNKASLGVSVLNLFDRNNVKYRQFTAALPVQDRNGNIDSRKAILGTETSQLDRTINFNFGIKF